MTNLAPVSATACLISLESYGFLSVEGARAAEFLQGQLTCDLRQASAEHAISGAWCTPKGRVVCSFLLWQASAEQVLLRLRADLLQSTLVQLSRYGALSRVRIVEAPMRCLGILGEPSTAARAALAQTWPAEAGHLRPVEGGVLLRADAAGQRHELWLDPQAAVHWAGRLAELLPGGSESDWRLALVRANAAEIQAATRELFLPQMLRYDTNGSVSFRKGCYTGQEIVARTHYKGGVKRHLQHLTGAASPPPPGSSLIAGTQPAGTVVESAPDGRGGCEVLAVLADELATGPSGAFLSEAGDTLRLPA
jgi:folate-binding protein YgfZ